MGAPAALGNPEEKPAHEAIVAAFYLDKTEVTVAAYQRCVADGGCEKALSTHRFCNVKLEDRNDHPINCVDLYRAAAYCAWAGKRLPTEREWEYAASNGAERRRFSWGNHDPSSEIACYDHPGGSCKVASFEPGAFGLYDMNGSVWEWTSSAFLPYPSAAKPDAIDRKKRFVYRGGSWSRRFPKWLRNLLRNRYEPDKFSASIGMRCAKTVEPLQCPADTEPRDGACVRVRGEVLCEPNYAFDGKECRPDVEGQTAAQRGTWPPTRNTAAVDFSQLTVPQAGASAESVSPTITRSRTPQHDADCKRHWPKTPASYLFKGGPNFPSRKPALSAAGCVPRDMGWSWTSACCPN
ncbi:MAG: SUMF1/EgtB/PvdO family nonheme iron enzyme [Deltaproteobacteria bacterium]|nr:SUMF1/EgtB/PvdO family nonheme iron enzyme [Deltaproteobacteria bacterium]MBW2532535.1 SUMF1/EgtB/PvdO family nonheme iron enzyme [Deltaproteobacteria bacterium]